MTKFLRFLQDDSGATAIEYGLIAALVSIVIISGIGIIGTQLGTTFNSIGSSLKAANS